MSCQYMNLTACMTYQLRKWFVHILIHGNYSLIHFNVETGKTCPEVQKKPCSELRHALGNLPRGSENPVLNWDTLLPGQRQVKLVIAAEGLGSPGKPGIVQHGLKPCSWLELYLNSGSLFRVGSQIYIGWECGEIVVMTVIRMSCSHPDE